MALIPTSVHWELNCDFCLCDGGFRLRNSPIIIGHPLHTHSQAQSSLSELPFTCDGGEVDSNQQGEVGGHITEDIGMVHVDKGTISQAHRRHPTLLHNHPLGQVGAPEVLCGGDRMLRQKNSLPKSQSVTASEPGGGVGTTRANLSFPLALFYFY